jgi:hypothetical protein
MTANPAGRGIVVSFLAAIASPGIGTPKNAPQPNIQVSQQARCHTLSVEAPAYRNSLWLSQMSR